LGKKTLFVRVEKYKDALESVEKIKWRIGEAEAALTNLQKIKRQEEAELEKWRRDIDNIKRILVNMDNSLFRQ